MKWIKDRLKESSTRTGMGMVLGVATYFYGQDMGGTVETVVVSFGELVGVISILFSLSPLPIWSGQSVWPV